MKDNEPEEFGMLASLFMIRKNRGDIVLSQLCYKFIMNKFRVMKINKRFIIALKII